MNDIGAVEIAAGLAGTVTIGTLIFLMMQNIRAFWPTMEGRDAEVMVITVSTIAVAIAFLATDANWKTTETWIAFFVSTLSATIVARGIYAQLFKASVRGVPIDPRASVSANMVNASVPPDDVRVMTDGERQQLTEQIRRVRS